jgi:hypothetical protein
LLYQLHRFCVCPVPFLLHLRTASINRSIYNTLLPYLPLDSSQYTGMAPHLLSER